MTVELSKNEVKVLHPNIYAIFWEDKAVINLKSSRKVTESLHDYFIRMEWKCPCRVCR